MRANIKYVLNFYEYFFFDQILTMISDHYAEPLKTSCSRLREFALKSVMDVLASLRCVCVRSLLPSAARSALYWHSTAEGELSNFNGRTRLEI